jgi:short-subunit dehydrogenase
MELAPEGITVTALCPGPVPTEFLQVASRPGEITRTEDRSPSALHATAAEVVRDALRALEKNKPDVVPNMFLALLIRGALLLPFPIRRMVISLGAGPRSSKAGKH